MDNEPVFTAEEQALTIAELQECLRIISRENVGIPRVAVDGIYSLDTKLAVTAFQKEYGLEETGEADCDTWETILREAAHIKESHAPANPAAVFHPSHLIVKPGGTGDIVFFIQVMLRSVCRFIDHIEPISIDGCYGNKTSEAVKRIQEIAGLEQTGCVDKKTWNELTNLYFQLNKLKNSGINYSHPSIQ